MKDLKPNNNYLFIPTREKGYELESQLGYVTS